MEDSQIKVVALDIYGVVLCEDDDDNCMPPRPGIEKFFDHCASKGVKVCACSDAEPLNVRIALGDCGFEPDRFDHFFHLNQLPRKDFSQIVRHYGVKPNQVLVMGNHWEKDIMGAKEHGCLAICVPDYVSGNKNFDFGEVYLE